MGKTPEELLNELSEADAALLGEDCQALIRAIGLEGFKKLIQEFSGVQLYIPKQEKVCRYLRDKKIRQEFDGSNHKTLAKKYGVTEAWCRNGQLTSREAGSVGGQMVKKMIQQYENELARIRGQIRSMEQTGEADTDRRKYRQLKQIRSELQSSIRQMKQYTKKG